MVHHSTCLPVHSPFQQRSHTTSVQHSRASPPVPPHQLDAAPLHRTALPLVHGSFRRPPLGILTSPSAPLPFEFLATRPVSGNDMYTVLSLSTLLVQCHVGDPGAPTTTASAHHSSTSFRVLCSHLPTLPAFTAMPETRQRCLELAQRRTPRQKTRGALRETASSHHMCARRRSRAQ